MAGSDERLTALLNVHSYFSFGAGTASPTTLVKRAVELGYRYIALTDDGNVSGGVELFQAAREARGRDFDIKALIGATVLVSVPDRAPYRPPLSAPLPAESRTPRARARKQPRPPPRAGAAGAAESYPFVLIAKSREGYATLCRLLTLLHSREERDVPFPALLEHNHDLILLSGARDGLVPRMLAARKISELEELLEHLKDAFPERFYLQLFHDHYRWDSRRSRAIRRLAARLAVQVVSAPEVRYALPDDYRLYDALTCARLGISVQEPHPRRPQNACQYLPGAEEVSQRLPFPEGTRNAARIAKQAYFELLPEKISPPRAAVPEGYASASDYLERRCLDSDRLAKLVDPDKRDATLKRLRQELEVIAPFDLADFFLVAAEITDFCRNSGILAAGRGSAAASVVCYLLGVSNTNPLDNGLLFERFLHSEMTVMPDIDIDISSVRRDDVLAWAEQHFGATAEAMVCNKITYRLPLALQDLGRALGLPKELRDHLTKALGRDFRGLSPAAAREAEVVFREVLGDAPAAEALLDLLSRMERGHVRHLAPHSGGVAMVREELTHYSPLERSSGGIRLLQLDKDDAEDMGLVKLDLLGLRMLSALERAREDVLRLNGIWLDLAELPDDPRVWDLIAKGATLGIFQVESPSQMQTSRFMHSRSIHDLAHQIALIRPGPIQSGTVHPYLRRKNGQEKITYWHPKLEQILHKTYGVLLFQDDVLRVAVEFAGMSWKEASRFRKNVSDWSDSLADLEPYREKFVSGAMNHSGASREEALLVFDAIKGYQGFGFSESHAWTFALHAYASGWLRVSYPAEFMAAILNEEPGMWPQMTKRQEARDWGIPFLPFDINHSGGAYHCDWAHVAGRTLKAIRPPLTAIAGVSEEIGRELMLERLRHGPYRNVDDVYQRLPLPRDTLEAVVRAGAFDDIQPRREALFRVGALSTAQPGGETAMLSGVPPAPELPRLTKADRFYWDKETTGLSTLEMHLTDLYYYQLRELGCVPLLNLRRSPHKVKVRTAGLIVARQKPPTAKGFAFFVIEDGPVRSQVIIPPDLWVANRQLLRDASLLVLDAIVEDTGHQLTLKALSLAHLPVPITVRGYHYG